MTQKAFLKWSGSALLTGIMILGGGILRAENGQNDVPAVSEKIRLEVTSIRMDGKNQVLGLRGIGDFRKNERLVLRIDPLYCLVYRGDLTLKEHAQLRTGTITHVVVRESGHFEVDVRVAARAVFQASLASLNARRDMYKQRIVLVNPALLVNGLEQDLTAVQGMFRTYEKLLNLYREKLEKGEIRPVSAESREKETLDSHFRRSFTSRGSTSHLTACVALMSLRCGDLKNAIMPSEGPDENEKGIDDEERGTRREFNKSVEATDQSLSRHESHMKKVRLLAAREIAREILIQMEQWGGHLASEQPYASTSAMADHWKRLGVFLDRVSALELFSDVLDDSCLGGLVVLNRSAIGLISADPGTGEPVMTDGERAEALKEFRRRVEELLEKIIRDQGVPGGDDGTKQDEADKGEEVKE